ncbi:MAG: serine hydrolase, partial [Methanosarcinaceae archaeon]|nr:serine hydrolase [Methanosarcinaceae archaeon]
MNVNTIFDLASLTKVIATTTAVMQLAEDGKISMKDPVSKYWPEFGANGKEEITVQNLLTHYSGMRPDLPLGNGWSGYKTAVGMILDEKPLFAPGTRFMYSDINFEILGELVRRISDQSLDIYCAENIFNPLGMKHTFFKPAASLKNSIAPTQYRHGRKGEILCGEVHDPAAQRMDGVAGHAGLFSTADDLSLFARMLLDRGEINGVRILKSSTVETMTSPQSPSGNVPLRGLGWDIAPPFASNRDELVPAGSFGHRGYTGTFIWIDPLSRTYVIILTNRVHPNGKGDAEPLRKKIVELVSRVSGTLSNDQVFAKRPALKGIHTSVDSNEKKDFTRNRIQTGIDVLKEEDFEPLAGLRVGLITNHTGIDSNGKRSIDVLYKAPNVKLVAIFSPEHGVSGRANRKVLSTTDIATGLPIYSLYGKTKRPTEEMLDGIDALVFDIQSAGVRFYTYITTLGYAMEEAAERGITFYVLDRPNPLNGLSIQGPIMDE